DVIDKGKGEGDIHSSKHVELAAKAEVNGNVYYNLIEMVKGSAVDGNLVHTESRDAGKGTARVTMGKAEDTEDKAGEATEEAKSRVTSVQTKQSGTA
ncbi:MAG: polymer-forming cytoskeletal protein, partial [Pseudomonadales bacterium]|nr:polymer-forming cytoskeletal protein [Pseudomonadales bacterium]